MKSRKNKTNHDLIHRALVQRSRVRKEFERFDADQSGYITKQEVLNVIVAVHELMGFHASPVVSKAMYFWYRPNSPSP